MRRACLLLAILLFPSQVLAMPTFARRYRTSCATCHQTFPRLNAVGESFRLNGFRFVNDEQYRKEPPVELGDEAYKRLWPRALWPTDVPSNSPLSIVTRQLGEVDLDGSRAHRVMLLFPEEIELVWVANFGDDISVYGDVIFLQKDFGGGDLRSWATLKGWIQFQDLIGDNKLNLRVGTVGTQSLGLFTARDANFYGTHYYLYSSWTLPKVWANQAALAAFKGNAFSMVPQAGLEANGFGKRWTYAAGVVSGDAVVPPAGQFEEGITFMGAGAGGVNDVYAQFAYKFGGAPFDRSGDEQAASLSTAAEFWRDDSTTVSFFGYRGRATIRGVFPDGTVQEDTDTFWRVGIGAQHQVRDLSLGAGWVKGNNRRPYGLLSDRAIASDAWFVETLYFVRPWLLPFARLESLDLDFPAGLPGLSPEQDVTRLVVGSRAMIRPNVGVIAETGFYRDPTPLDEGHDRTLFVMLLFSF